MIAEESLTWSAEYTVVDYTDRLLEVYIASSELDCIRGTFTGIVRPDGSLRAEDYDLCVDAEDQADCEAINGLDLRELLREWFTDNADRFVQPSIYEAMKYDYTDNDWARCVVEYDPRTARSWVAMSELGLPESLQTRVQALLDDPDARF